MVVLEDEKLKLIMLQMFREGLAFGHMGKAQTFQEQVDFVDEMLTLLNLNDTMKPDQAIWSKQYEGFESLPDLIRDIQECEFAQSLDGEFTGTLKVAMTYE